MLNALYTLCYKDALEIDPTLIDGINWDTVEHTNKLKEMIYAKYFNYEISGETIGEQKIFMEQKFNQYKDYYAEMLAAYETSIAWLDGEITSHSEESEFAESGSETTTDDTELTHGHTETNSGNDVNTIQHGHVQTEGGNDTTTQTKGITETTTTEREEEVTRTRYDLPRSVASQMHATEIVKEKPDGATNTTTVTPGDGEDETTVDYGHTLTNTGTDTDTLAHGKKITHGGKDVTDRDISVTKSKSGDNSHSATTKVADLINQKDRYLKLIRSLYAEFADRFLPCFITMFS